MSVSSSDKSLSEDDVSIMKPEEYKYDLRLEISVKEGSGTIKVASIFRGLVQRMRTAANGKPLVVLTATDNLYFDQKDMTAEEFQQAFKVDRIDGRVSKIILGFKIRTTVTLSEIKQQIIATHLIPNGLFLREHAGGFGHGVKHYTFGFLKDEHPDHPDVSQLNNAFAHHISAAWKNMDKDDKAKWKKQLPELFYGSQGITVPIIFTKDRVTAEVDNKVKVITHALMVSTPNQYGQLVRILLTAIVMDQKITNLIPFALYRENPNGYYNILVNQERFMEVHRNIPILNVPIAGTSMVSVKGKTLLQALTGNKDILRVSYDLKFNRYHVSTRANHYRDVHKWIEKVLQEHQFPFSPRVRPLKFGGKSTFSSIFTEAMSVTNESYDASTIKTTRSNAWKNRPPLDISYVADDDAFPALPKASPPVPATPSTTSETLFDEETIQSAISAAFKKLETQHREELDLLKKEMQSKIDLVESQMKELGKQVATQTYQALLTEDSPLVTKTDHAHLQHEMQVISTQLSTIIQLFQSGSQPITSASPQHTPPQSPTTNRHSLRMTKRSKPSHTPEKLFDEDEPMTQENLFSSATSDHSVGSEGCEN